MSTEKGQRRKLAFAICAYAILSAPTIFATPQNGSPRYLAGHLAVTNDSLPVRAEYTDDVLPCASSRRQWLHLATTRVVKGV